MLAIAPFSKAEIPEDCHDVGTPRGDGFPCATFLEVFSYFKCPFYTY